MGRAAETRRLRRQQLLVFGALPFLANLLVGAPSPNVKGDWLLAGAGLLVAQALVFSPARHLLERRPWLPALAGALLAGIAILSISLHLDLPCWHGYRAPDGSCAWE